MYTSHAMVTIKMQQFKNFSGQVSDDAKHYLKFLQKYMWIDMFCLISKYRA